MPEDVTPAQRRMVLEGVFSRAMDAATGGVVLAGFALALGATDLQLGMLAAIPFVAQLANLPAVALLARFRSPKAVTVAATAVSRLGFVGFALLALLPGGASPWALLALLAAYAAVASVGGAAWQVWTRALVPRERLGRYFGSRMVVLGAVGLGSTLAVGLFLHVWTRAGAPALPAYAGLYLLGAALGLASSFVLLRTDGARLPLREGRGLRATLLEPFRHRNFRRILVFLGAWGFAANLALPFLTVVVLRALGYPIAVALALAALSQLANLAAFRMWGPVVDAFGNKPVLGLGASVFVVAMLALAFLPDERGAAVLAVLVLAHVLLGLATAALDLASSGLVMKCAEEDSAAAYMASASVVKAVAAGAAPLLGGLAVHALAGRALVLEARWTGPARATVLGSGSLAHYDFLFLASALLGLYALHRLLAFDEPGEAPPAAVARALRRDVVQVSSVAGMRQFAHLASYVVEASYRFERAVDLKRALREEDEG